MIKLENIIVLLKLVIIFFLTPGFIYAEEVITIVSDDVAEIDVKNRSVLFKTNVVVSKKNDGSTLRSDKLIIIKSADGLQTVLEAEGGVEFVDISSTSDLTRRGLTINCDWLYLNRLESWLRLKGEVVVEFGDYKLEGDKVEYGYAAGKGKITSKEDSQVTFVFLPKPQKSKTRPDGALLKHGFKGTANEILISKPAQKVTFQGKAVLIDTETKSELKAKRVEIFFDAKRQIKEIIANENFSMSRPGYFSSADRAVLKYDKQIIFLHGDAYVKEKDKIEIKSSGIKIFIKNGKNIIKSLDDAPIKMEVPWQSSPG